METSRTHRLTPKQRSFVEAYITCLNGAEAVRRSAYKVAPANASAFANKLLNTPSVKAAIADWQRRRSSQTTITADEVLTELSHTAFLDPLDVLNPDWTPKPLAEMGDAAKAVKKAQARVQHNPDGTVREVITTVEFHDKLSALDKIARQLGLYEEDREAERQQDVLEEIRERVGAAMARGFPMPIGGIKPRA